jgi:replicative DNA helicase
MQDNVTVDYLTVYSALGKKRVEEIGGVEYLIALGDDAYKLSATGEYVRILKDMSLRTQVLKLCYAACERLSGTDDARLIVSETAADLEKALVGKLEEVTLADQAEAEIELIRRQRTGEVKTFVTSGLELIDETHGGFALGELTVIGARPNVGKSTLLRQAIRANCLLGNFSHLFTPEMSAGQILRLYAAMEAQVPFRQVRHSERLTHVSMLNVEAAMRDISQWPLEIDDRSPLTPGELISRARTVKRRKDSKLVGVDYLQKLKYGGKAEQRHIYVTDAMVALASLAKTERMAVVAISSLTEGGEKNRNAPPKISDFRQSGDIQYEANTAILLHREVDAATQKMVPETSIIFGKARSDEQGCKTAYFDPDYIRFVDQQEFLSHLGK